MLDKHKYVTGTVRENRKGLPSQVKAKHKVKCDLIAVRSGQFLSTSWIDRKPVRILSTSAPVEVTRHKQTRTIPKIVVDYNKGMGGIDKSDQFAVELKTVKCWRKVVFHLISKTPTNAYLCYLENSNITGKKMTHFDFQVALVKGLIAGYDEPRTRAGRPSLVADEARLTARYFIGYIPENKRRKCEVYTQDKSVGFKGSRIRT